MASDRRMHAHTHSHTHTHTHLHARTQARDVVEPRITCLREEVVRVGQEAPVAAERARAAILRAGAEGEVCDGCRLLLI